MNHLIFKQVHRSSMPARSRTERQKESSNHTINLARRLNPVCQHFPFVIDRYLPISSYLIVVVIALGQSKQSFKHANKAALPRASHCPFQLALEPSIAHVGAPKREHLRSASSRRRLSCRWYAARAPPIRSSLNTLVQTSIRKVLPDAITWNRNRKKL